MSNLLYSVHWQCDLLCGHEAVKRLTRSMTGVLSRRQYLDITERKHNSRPSSLAAGHSSVFKLGERYLTFAFSLI